MAVDWILYTDRSCGTCNRYEKHILEQSIQQNKCILIVDCNDPRIFQMAIAGFRKYSIKKIPTLVEFSDDKKSWELITVPHDF